LKAGLLLGNELLALPAWLKKETLATWKCTRLVRQSAIISDFFPNRADA
jgi:hypothetical protein